MLSQNSIQSQQFNNQQYQELIESNYKICFDKSRIFLDSNQQDTFDETKCQICLNEVANNPLLCPECNKIFGFECALKLVKTNTSDLRCPSCKCTWKIPLSKYKNRFARDIISKTYKIVCKNADFGCKELIKCQQENIIQHESTCQYQKVECLSKSLKCGWQGLKSGLKAHKEQCPLLVITCQYCKNEQEPQHEFFKKEDHMQNCPNRPEKCPFCQETFTNKQCQIHIQQNLCPKKLYTCKGCKNSFQREGFLKHENENCYKQGKESQMFDKTMEQIVQLKETLQKQVSHYEILQKKQQLFNQLMLKLDQSQNKTQILEDFEKGIIHFYSLEQLNQIFKSGVQIKSVIVNETDLNRYTYSKDLKTDFTPVINHIQKLANFGDSWSQFSLGLLYYCGDKDISMDDQLAFQWADCSASQGNPGGECLLGLHYLFGYHVEKNYEKAYINFIKSSKQNFPPAFYYLGDCYINGKGVHKDLKKGLECYEISSELGYPYALKSLAEKYEDETIRDTYYLEKAYTLYLKAADKGVIGAMESVKQCLQLGRGVKQNIIKANIWQQKIDEAKKKEQSQKQENPNNNNVENPTTTNSTSNNIILIRQNSSLTANHSPQSENFSYITTNFSPESYVSE